MTAMLNEIETHLVCIYLMVSFKVEHFTIISLVK